MCAAAGDFVCTVRTLAALGADLNSVAENGATPVQVAHWGGHTATVQALTDLGARMW